MALVQRLLTVTFQLGSGTFAETGQNTLTLSKLRASASIVKAGGPSLSALTLKVYGMTKSHMDQLSTLGLKFQLLPKNIVTVAAGAADGSQPSIVFVGTITKAYADFSSMPEVSFVVSAHTGAAENVMPFPPSSFQGSSDVASIMSGLATAMGYSFENSGVSTRLSNVYLWGSAREQARRVAEHAGIEMIMDDGVLAIWPRGKSRGGLVPLVSPQTGLVGYPNYDAMGVVFRTLFNPSIGYGKQLQLQSSQTRATGIWTVYSLQHDLEALTPRGKWFSTVGVFNQQSAAVTPLAKFSS